MRGVRCAGAGGYQLRQVLRGGEDHGQKTREWGTARAIALCCTDKVMGLEDVVEPWMDTVLDGLARACDVIGGEVNDKKVEEVEEKEKGKEEEKEKGKEEEKEKGKEEEKNIVALVGEKMGGLAVSNNNTTSGGNGGKTLLESADAIMPQAKLMGSLSIILSAGGGTEEADAAVADIVTPVVDHLTCGSVTGNNFLATLDEGEGYPAVLNDDSKINDNLTPTTRSPMPLFLLYGLATGNAEHITKDLASTYESYLHNPSFVGYFPSVVCCELNHYKKRCLDTWSEPPHPKNHSVKHGMLIICSMTGNANAPENAD